MASDYARLGIWKAVGLELGVSAGTAQRVATDDEFATLLDARNVAILHVRAMYAAYLAAGPQVPA